MFVYTIDHIIALVVIGGFLLVFAGLWLLSFVLKACDAVRRVWRKVSGGG